MSELVFLKLGGSLLTDKTQHQALRTDVLARLAGEIRAAMTRRPELRLVLGHGSGSFGHIAASRHGTRQGVHTPEQWRSYAETGLAAGKLSYLVGEALWDAGVPVLRIQPSATARCVDGELRTFDERPVLVAMEHGLVPVLHGDVALDEVRGGTIVSTEELFRWLAPRLQPKRVVLVGEVDGVLTADPASGVAGDLVPEISTASLPGLARSLGGSRGFDVTGGMVAKVREMLALLASTPGLDAVQIISGLKPGLVTDVLVDPTWRAGTRIVPD